MSMSSFRSRPGPRNSEATACSQVNLWAYACAEKDVGLLVMRGTAGGA